jgi:hypothetical protein
LVSVQADLGQALFLVTRQLRCPEFNPYHVRDSSTVATTSRSSARGLGAP